MKVGVKSGARKWKHVDWKTPKSGKENAPLRQRTGCEVRMLSPQLSGERTRGTPSRGSGLLPCSYIAANIAVFLIEGGGGGEDHTNHNLFRLRCASAALSSPGVCGIIVIDLVFLTPSVSITSWTLSVCFSCSSASSHLTLFGFALRCVLSVLLLFWWSTGLEWTGHMRNRVADQSGRKCRVRLWSRYDRGGAGVEMMMRMFFCGGE